jgi:hypothetical protein
MCSTSIYLTNEYVQIITEQITSNKKTALQNFLGEPS